MLRHVEVQDGAELKIFSAPPIRRNWHAEQFIVLVLKEIKSGYPKLEPSDPLRKRKLQVEEVARQIVRGRIFEVVVPEKPYADLGSLGEDRWTGIGESCSRREIPDVVADTPGLLRRVGSVICSRREDHPEADKDRQALEDGVGARKISRAGAFRRSATNQTLRRDRRPHWCSRLAHQ